MKSPKSEIASVQDPKVSLVAWERVGQGHPFAYFEVPKLL